MEFSFHILTMQMARISNANDKYLEDNQEYLLTKLHEFETMSYFHKASNILLPHESISNLLEVEIHSSADQWSLFKCLKLEQG